MSIEHSLKNRLKDSIDSFNLAIGMGIVRMVNSCVNPKRHDSSQERSFWKWVPWLDMNFLGMSKHATTWLKKK